MLFYCPAKINLFLKITGKNADGYHNLESLLAFLDLADLLKIEKSNKFKLEIDGEFADLIDQKNNILSEILDFFVSNFNVTKNLDIKLTKNIPVAAGLGGGSSDAAYFIHALNKIFSLNLHVKELQKISLNFGSDIAFLLQNKAAIIKGRGDEIIEFADFKPISALLINPKIALSTKEVFQKFSDNFYDNFSGEIAVEELIKKDVFDLLKDLQNDLEKPAKAILPIISEILDYLKNSHAIIAKMSGSGASCFAIFADDKNLEFAAKNFIKKFPHFFVKKVRILSHV
ncbi:MAG: 4-(cytidine 5'-diphospho)-2-C-methyl-D-erythritol kinase [Rickettsiales bacterium]|nr:4-(cytidine 5'-diphospho)-2-C-methyl-D-erythritol kinase [Rickettsiales bacterium]